ncbi:LIM domain kinase 2 [Larimichthys crocea]|uniref:Uncharacterized protein n=1 Tax=Larimichthys crocea TaxID=215358 RepID=A0ACD3Q810_LARCR|nr:LIM domain kinase 2 [Larimichthys crocea]
MEEPEGTDGCYCAGCGGKIQDSFQMKVLQDTWHNACFQCSVCCDHLTNWYYEKDGKLYCRKHYWEKFGELCHGCSLLMTGPAMVAGEHKYHPECFVCLSCKVVIEDRDTYALVERSKLYCGKCYKQVILTPMLEKRSHDSGPRLPASHGDPHLHALCSQWQEGPLRLSVEGRQRLSECSSQRGQRDAY